MEILQAKTFKIVRLKYILKLCFYNFYKIFFFLECVGTFYKATFQSKQGQGECILQE